MPGTSGFQLCSMLKKDAEIAHIPVIFLSAIHDSPNKVHGLDLGAMDFISKPFEEADLKAHCGNRCGPLTSHVDMVVKSLL